MNVVVDVSSLAREGLTGIGVYIQHLVEGLVASGEVGVRAVYRARLHRRRALIARHLSIAPERFVPLVSERHVDVYHGPDFRLPRLLTVPSVVTVHDLAVFETGLLDDEFAQSGRRKVARLIERRRPDRIIAVSQFTHDRLIEIFPAVAGRVDVVHLGVDAPDTGGAISAPLQPRDVMPAPPQPRGTMPAPLQSRDVMPKPLQARGADLGAMTSSDDTPSSRAHATGIESPYLLYLGTLERRKNVVAVVEAFERLAWTGLRLVIAGGDGFDAGSIHRRIDASPARAAIHRLGFVDEALKAALLRDASAFVYPSSYEGFGLPVLEAMAAGCPVVTTSYGAVAEVAGDAALLVAPIPDEIAGAVAQVLGDDALRRRLIDTGRARAARFTWDRCVAETIETYRRARN